MRAIDTNVAARFILNDDHEQADTARRILEDGVFVPLTVLQELGWLLGWRYGFARAEVADMLSGLVDLPTVTVLDRPKTVWALERYARRGDLADLLHLIGSGPSECFATFDQGVARAAADAPVRIETLG